MSNSSSLSNFLLERSPLQISWRRHSRCKFHLIHLSNWLTGCFQMFAFEYLMDFFGPFFITPSQLSRLKAICVCNGTAAYLAVNRLQIHKYIIHSDPTLVPSFEEAELQARAIRIDDFHEHCWTWEPPKTLCDAFESVSKYPLLRVRCLI